MLYNFRSLSLKQTLIVYCCEVFVTTGEDIGILTDILGGISWVVDVVNLMYDSSQGWLFARKMIDIKISKKYKK